MIRQRDTYKFCTNCQAELKEESNLKTCPKCGKHYYFNAKPTITVILIDSDGRILLTKRAYEPFKDWWDFPGGFVEEDEPLEQAAQRELEEEIGITVTDFDYLGSFAEDYHYRDEIVPVVAAVFAGTMPSGSSVAVGDDVSGYKFFARDDLDFEKIAFKNQRLFVQNYFK
jgi:NAD+ diphosphatase